MRENHQSICNFLNTMNKEKLEKVMDSLLCITLITAALSCFVLIISISLAKDIVEIHKMGAILIANAILGAAVFPHVVNMGKSKAWQKRVENAVATIQPAPKLDVAVKVPSTEPITLGSIFQKEKEDTENDERFKN